MAPRTQKTKDAVGRSATSRSRESNQVARCLQEIIELLAPLLLAHGVTPLRIAGLAKEALVTSAAGVSRMSTGRVNHSRVAAMTGLSRVDVRRILGAAAPHASVSNRALDRSARVVAGWLRDPQFLDASGKPKTLSRKVGRTSFAELVRLHSGDIPPRVVLESLRDRGIIRVTPSGISLRATPKHALSPRANALPDIAPYVKELLGAAATDGARLAYAHGVDFYAKDAPREILLTERVVRALSATVAALNSIDAASIELPKSADLKKVSVIMTVTTAEGATSAPLRVKKPKRTSREN